MGQKDISEKVLEAHNDVFADIVNGLLFGGESVVREEQLEDAAPGSAYKQDGKYHELERDVVKRWTDGNIRIACIGIENQTGSDADMPIRVLAYDAAEYRAQLNSGDTTERYPVISLVLYFGHNHPWNQPRSLYERIRIPERWKEFVSDYRINVFEIAYLPREIIDRFHSDFGIVADYFWQMRTKKDYVPSGTVMTHVQETLSLLAIMTGDRRFEEAANEVKASEIAEGKKEAGTMEEFLDRIENRGVERGRTEGRMEGRVEGRMEGRAESLIESVRNLMDTLKLTMDQAMDALKIPESERELLRSNL